MKTIEIRSPAKLNLFLEVIGKRGDGYHDIATVFEKIDLFDNVRFTETRSGVKLCLAKPALVPAGRENLAFRAAELVKKAYDIDLGVDIELEKNIPVAAGLGGGSSNAAAVLCGLNKLWDLGLTETDLSKLAGQLGADVPFFVFNHSFAVGKGRGDEIAGLESDMVLWHLLISPPVQVSTKDIYSEVNLNLTADRHDVRMMACAIRENSFEGVERSLHNALERIVCRQVSQIGKIKRYFESEWGRPALITGSGPSVFSVAKSREEAVKQERGFADYIRKECKSEEWRTFVVKTLA